MSLQVVGENRLIICMYLYVCLLFFINITKPQFQNSINLFKVNLLNWNLIFLVLLQCILPHCITVISDERTEELVSAINGAVGPHVTFNSTPLLEYETFAQNTNKVPAEKVIRETRELQPNFYLLATIEQKGIMA